MKGPFISLLIFDVVNRFIFTSPFHWFTNPRRDKSVYFWSWGSYLLCMCQNVGYKFETAKSTFLNLIHISVTWTRINGATKVFRH